MWILDGVIAGLVAGILMGIFSQVGYWLGIVRSHLIVIDGAFVLRIMKRSSANRALYVVGIVIHLATSIIFGSVYVAIARIAGFDIQHAGLIALYVFVLWLAMLAIALPIAGQGFMGNKIRRYVWLEQIVLHIIFGFGFWWSLGFV
jgi:hypothetical protein